MWKLIVKNVWNRRRRNAWLTIEMTIVAVITWVVIDPVVVLLYSKHLPLGYDADRLVVMNVVTKAKELPDYDANANDSASVATNNLRIADLVEALPEVERVTPLHSMNYVNSKQIQNGEFFVGDRKCQAVTLNFFAGDGYLQTYGFEAVEGSPDVAELDETNYGMNDILITENVAKALGLGKHPQDWKLDGFYYYQMDTVHFRVRGILKDICHRRSELPYPVVLVPNFHANPWAVNLRSWNLLVRLKEGVSPRQFLNTHRDWLIERGIAGNQYVRSMHPYTDELDSFEFWNGTAQKIRTNVVMAVFFFISLLLGVIGTFWLQTRKRTEEAGIMRSFGATPGHIVRMLLGEGVVLCTISCLIGFWVYLQYAVMEGLDMGRSSVNFAGDSWVSHFWMHFAVVSLVVYLLLLVIVLLGVYIPARGISRVSPVDALKDE